MEVQINGVGTVITGLDDASNKIRAAAWRGTTKALERAAELSRGMISEGDHTLKELATLGHPYGFTNPQVIHDPDTVVHAQTGDYIDALRVTKPVQDATGDIFEGEVKIDDSQAELDRWIQQGTTKMRARPWMEDIVDNHGEELANIVLAEIEAAVAREALRP